MEDVSRAPGAPPEVDDEQVEQVGWGIAVLLEAAVFAAVIGGRAAFRSATATYEWQAAVREQAKHAAAAYVEDIRFVYTSEEPVAFLLTEAQFRSEELERVAAGLTGPTARWLSSGHPGLCRQRALQVLDHLLRRELPVGGGVRRRPPPGRRAG